MKEEWKANYPEESQKTDGTRREWKFPRIGKVFIAIIIGFTIGFTTCMTKPWKKLPIITTIDDTAKGKNYMLTISNVEKVLKPASDLVTIRYCYTDADTYENTKEFFGKKLPFTTDKVVFTYDGVISAGIDFSAVQYDIDNDSKVIHITLPEPGIISNEIDESSFKFPYISDSVFNSTDMSDYIELIDQLKKEKAQKVLKDTEFMNSAKENTEKVLKGFLTSSDKTKDYTVSFKY